MATLSERTTIEGLRSWMFVPTSPERFLAKVSSRPVDAIMPDLEDGVVASERPAGRINLARWLAGREAELPVPFVRVNGIRSAEWREDVEAAIGAAGVVLPKAESAADVELLDEALAAAERRRDAAVGSTRVIAAIESAVGLLAAPQIAAAPRVVGLLFGAEDYALDLGLSLRRSGAGADLLQARADIVVAARAAGAGAIDGVHTALDDEQGLREQSRLARELGFCGKSLFHPAQIETINAAFTPGREELGFAAEVIEKFEAATAAGQGAVAVQGHLIDLPIAARARRLLRDAAEFERRDQRRQLAGD
jgi:citrate lyase subunit beta/citryl-CoA lyase